MRVAVLVPSLGRAAQMEAHIGKLVTQPIPDNVCLSVYIAYCQSDHKTLAAAQRLQRIMSPVTVILVQRPDGSTAVEGWNLAYKHAITHADWFALGADDCIWHEDWLLEATDAISPGVEVVGMNDGHTNLDDYAPHYMMTRKFIDEHMGGVFVPADYKSWWFDREVCERATAAGCYAPAWDSWVDHRHPDWGTAKDDSTYRRGRIYHQDDRQVYLERRKDYAI